MDIDNNKINDIPGLTTSTSDTGTEGKSYTTNYPFEDNYGQYCFNRLPCGICIRTNQMCPLVSNSQQIEINGFNLLNADLLNAEM